ncbi:hypothetical protein [Streptomyces pactum]|uniref:Uncharacterized protein n=1 Tax=Streptomyces pactum TaxID=68249 RepID=A0A1S6J8F4_9ACTN|nr:hypothetical protein [Streptomyces pactum]AQS68042.1 hypothetical protein B1H29_14855 [Streptomyces pactum]
MALVWAGMGGTAAAGTGATLPWDGGRSVTAVAVARQAAAQELAVWDARRAAAYREAVRKAVARAQEWQAAAVRADSGATSAQAEAQGGGAAREATPDVPAVGGSTAGGGSAPSAGSGVGARIGEALETPHPRPESEAGTDPEHRQAVEDSFTDPVKELTYSPAP